MPSRIIGTEDVKLEWHNFIWDNKKTYPPQDVTLLLKIYKRIGKIDQYAVATFRVVNDLHVFEMTVVDYWIIEGLLTEEVKAWSLFISKEHLEEAEEEERNV